jgi:hypothetical protein
MGKRSSRTSYKGGKAARETWGQGERGVIAILVDGMRCGEARTSEAKS